MQRIKDTKLFLLDMDGTFYLDDTLLPGALSFLELCRQKGIAFTFLTNNSSKSKAGDLAKLARLGVHITEREMFTSGDATLLYLEQEQFSKDILLVGLKDDIIKNQNNFIDTSILNKKLPKPHFKTVSDFINYEMNKNQNQTKE